MPPNLPPSDIPGFIELYDNLILALPDLPGNHRYVTALRTLIAESKRHANDLLGPPSIEKLDKFIIEHQNILERINRLQYEYYHVFSPEQVKILEEFLNTVEAFSKYINTKYRYTEYMQLDGGRRRRVRSCSFRRRKHHKKTKKTKKTRRHM